MRHILGNEKEGPLGNNKVQPVLYRVIINKCPKVQAISGDLFHAHKCIGHTVEETNAGHFIQNRFHHPVTFLPLTAGA